MLSRDDTLAFLQAAALGERQPGSAPEGDSSSAAAQMWSDRALDDEGVLDSYLSTRDLNRESLSGLLTGGLWSPRGQSVDWVRLADEWLISATLGIDEPSPVSGPLIVEGTRIRSLPFVGLLAPVVAVQRAHVKQHADLSEPARADLLDRLAETLATLALRCLLTELARDVEPGAYARLNASLTNSVARKRFYSRYPVLARDLVAAITAWREQADRLLARLRDDAELLKATGLLPSGIGALEAVRFAGDAHDSGQSVAILRFADGHRLVYKPRDCTIFSFYREVNVLLAQAIPSEAQLYSPISVAREGYGWVEYIERPQGGESDPRIYLRKVGGLLAIAHVLGASDLHLENVIASASGPVPVDLETLIQNRSRRESSPTAAALAVRALNLSVLGTGILPMQLTTGEGTSIDVSVVTGGLHQDSKTAVVHQIVDACTDGMRIDAATVPIGTSGNQPPEMTLATVRANRDWISAGFSETYRIILERRSEFIELLSHLPDLTVRNIVRATRSYSLLLTEMRQPTRLRSGIDRDHLLRSLWTRLADHPDESELVGSEERSLRRLDVPLFTTTLDSHSLDADGSVVAPDYFARTTREDVIARVKALDETTIDRSTALVAESVLAATTTQTGADKTTSEKDTAHSRRRPTSTRQLAEEQGRLLVDTAILGGDDATWISVCSSTDSTGLEYRPVGPTLYDGLAGITFSAAAAHRVLPRLGLDELAGRAAHAVAAILDDWSASRVTLPIGAFSGATGLLYSLARHDSLLGTDLWRTTRATAIRRLISEAPSDTYFDVMAGSAGAIAVLTAIPECASEEGQAALRALSTHLIDHSIELDDGSLVWESGTGRARLGGFSHGATGIGWALAKASKALGDKQIAAAASKALRFDDTLFDPAKQRWLDARPESLAQGRLFPVHWCHGASGIAMARAASATLLGEPDLLNSAGVGARETLANSLPTDDSLCHGSLGNLLALRAIEDHIHDNIDTTGFAEKAIDRISRSAIQSGLPTGITTVRGLMLGTAGALYALSREIDPTLPNVLVLA